MPWAGIWAELLHFMTRTGTEAKHLYYVLGVVSGTVDLLIFGHSTKAELLDWRILLPKESVHFLSPHPPPP